MVRRLVAIVVTGLVVVIPAGASAAGAVQASTLVRDLKTAPSHQGGYDRDLFRHWIDADGDGCDTRDEVLLAEARTPPVVTGSCRIGGGRWWSAYDDVLISEAGSLDVDHFVPLAEAWRSGAYRWTSGTRRSFANDLGYRLSVVAVTASSNRSKGDSDPAAWLPRFDRYRCTYVASWVAVKWRWRLTVDVAERASLKLGLAGCGRLGLVPTPTRAPIAVGEAAAPAPSGGQRDPRFPFCTDAIANGYGPYVAGVDPEYAWYRDGDGDGTVCER